MDLRVFFYRKFVVGQGRVRSIAREFLEKNEKKIGSPFLRMCRGRNATPSRRPGGWPPYVLPGRRCGSMTSIDPYI